MAILGLIILLLLIIMGIFADFIAPYGYAEMDWKSPFQHPSAQHWFGTDEFGRDIFSRIVYGARISLLVGFVSVGIAVVVGGTLGAIAGFYGKRVDNVIMRLMDILLSIPQTLLAIAIVAALGTGLVNLMIAVGVSSVPTYARIVRASVLTIVKKNTLRQPSVRYKELKNYYETYSSKLCGSGDSPGDAWNGRGNPDGGRHELYRTRNPAAERRVGQYALGRT